jgi:phosphoribosylformimino-5-aminoimidazole carboxamide ribotide isomerase
MDSDGPGLVNIIPVLDVQNGLVVRARAGQRHLYRPIETPLAAGSDPVDIAGGLLGIFPFKALYIADLNAITGKGDNFKQIVRVKEVFSNLDLWVDNGAKDQAAVAGFLDKRLGRLVLGSESQVDTGLLQELAQESRVVLSLDFRGDSFQGPLAIVERSELWTANVIVMTLSRIGGETGPDLERLTAIVEKAADRHVYAAGGVRNAGDLAALRSRGVAGALVASALHNGALSATDLAIG